MSGLPEGWVAATLEEISGVGGLVSDGDWIESKDQDPEGSVRLIQLMDVGDGHFTNRSNRFLNRETAERLRCTKLRAGDVLIARMPDPLGRACVFPGVDQEAVTAVDVLIWRAGQDGAVPEWLKYAVNSPDVRDDLALKAGGTTRQRVAGGVLKKLELPVPPLAEQRRIVAKLDALTARTARARADLDRIPALAARYKQAVLAKAFSGELTADWRISRKVPEPRMTTLASLVAEPIRNGLSVRGSDQPPGVRSLRLSALRGGAVNLGDVRFLPISDDHALRFQLREGDILVSRGNGTKTLVGIAALVGHVREPTIFPDTAFRIRVAHDRVNPQWLSHIWSAPQARAQIEAVAKTTAGIWKVSQADLAGIELPFFALPEQVEMVRRVTHALVEIDRLVAEAAAARRLLDRLDQAVLAKAFRGELVPQDPADEPASVLLDRIRAERAAAPKAKRGRKPALA